jgi:hypothetical protein
MTIASVRICYWCRDPARQLLLSRTHWGFAEWFKRRLKPIRQRLRGPEAKGVDIVNFMLHEDPQEVFRPNEWVRRANSFEYGESHDLAPLTEGVPIENIKKLMPWAAARAAMAPWPQVRAVGEALAQPLTDADEASLAPFLQWPRVVAV